MKKKRQYRHRSFMASVIAAVAMVAVLFFCFLMIHNINERMNESATSNLLNTTRVIEGNIENQIQKDFESLYVMGELYKDEMGLNTEEIKGLCEIMGFERVGMLDAQGNSLDGLTNQFKVWEMPSYHEWNLMEEGYSEAYYGESGRLQTVLWVPIYEGENFIGTIFGTVILSKYYSANVFTFYEGAGRTYLFDGSEGKWILRSLGMDGSAKLQNDIYSLLLNSGNTEDDINVFREAIKKKQTGTAELNFNGERSYICFMPLASSSDWYVATVIARDVLLKESTQVQQMIWIIFTVFCSTILFFAVILVIWQIRRTKINEAKYREILFANISSNIDSAFLIYDKEKKETVFVSDNVRRLFRIERDWLEADARNLFDWCNIEDNDLHKIAFLEGTLEQPAVCEVCVENELGVKSRFIRMELIPADLEQEIVVLTDITKDKDVQNSLIEAMQRAEAASNAKNNFLSAMSHDIRTPINGVIGMTAIASTHLDDKGRVKDCLKKINEASGHLMNIINEILDMSRIESGKMELSEEAFNLAELLQSVLGMNYPGIQQKNHAIKVYIHSMEHELVIGDPVRLQRIVDNLISNAIKYTPDNGKITLTLQENSSVIKGYGCYELIVQDNGVGMSPEFQKRLFQPFEREEDARTSKIQGTGLGMSIVKNITTLMMGDIQVESEKNKGTTFRVTVNLKLDEQKELEETKLAQLPVLVVDDDIGTCEMVADMLCDIGMIGEWADNGELAVQKVLARHHQRDDYLAVLLDWKMPVMDGLETARRIRAEVDCEIPIIILTAYDWSEIEEEARDAGVDSFLSKPLYKTKLQQKMLSLSNDEPEEADLSEAIREEKVLEGKRILLVEDNELNTEIAIEFLKLLNVEIDCAHNGADAVEKFAHHPSGTYDLILMDIQMPIMNGYEATRAIRNMKRSDSLSIPIIAMTADAFAQDVQNAFAAGMNEHIAKPISMERLIRVIKHYLS